MTNDNKIKPKDKPHYVNNRQFSQAVVEYVTEVKRAEERDDPIPIVPDYVAQCFMKIAEGLSHKSNFIRYTYREEMVMDAVENCLKAVNNYNIDAVTRTGLPNAFSYFTQICYYAFIRRITKEKHQQDIKFKWMEEVDPSVFMSDDGDFETASYYVEELRARIDKVREVDNSIKEFAKQEKKQQKPENQENQVELKGLEFFMGETQHVEA